MKPVEHGEHAGARAVAAAEVVGEADAVLAGEAPGVGHAFRGKQVGAQGFGAEPDDVGGI